MSTLAEQRGRPLEREREISPDRMTRLSASSCLPSTHLIAVGLQTHNKISSTGGEDQQEVPADLRKVGVCVYTRYINLQIKVKGFILLTESCRWTFGRGGSESFCWADV